MTRKSGVPVNDGGMAFDRSAHEYSAVVERVRSGVRHLLCDSGQGLSFPICKRKNHNDT